MRARSEVADGPGEAASWEPWLRGFVRDAERDGPVEDFVRTVDAGILADLPEIAGDPLLVEDLHDSTRSQWRAFLARVTQAEHRFDLPGQAAALARSLARRGMDLGVLLKVYRTASQLVFQHFTDVTDSLRLAENPPRDDVLVFLWNRAGQWLDDSVEQLIDAYYAERQQLHEGTLARRLELIDALLRGRPTGPEDPSRVLDHTLVHWQTAFVAWSSDEASLGTTDAMLRSASAFAHAVNAPRPLTAVPGSRDLWGWLATPVEPDLTALHGLAAELEERHMRLAVGRPAPGPAGFRSSHAEARAAHRLAVAAVGAPAVVHYRDVELLCLTSADDDLLRRMVRREAGPLCGGDKNLAQLRQTALAYLTTRSVEAAADQLFVHKNTVRYRIARAEERLGHPLTERAALLEVALRHVATFGPPALEERRPAGDRRTDG